MDFSTLSELERKRCSEDPVYFYNQYCRKPGDPELGADELAEVVERRMKHIEPPKMVRDYLGTLPMSPPWGKGTLALQGDLRKDLQELIDKDRL